MNLIDQIKQVSRSHNPLAEIVQQLHDHDLETLDLVTSLAKLVKTQGDRITELEARIEILEENQ